MNGVLAELNSERQKRSRGSEADAPAESKKAKAPVVTTALLGDLHAARRERQGLPAPVEPPAPAELPAPEVEAPAQDMDVDEAAPPPVNADDAASVRSADAVVVERLIGGNAAPVAGSDDEPQCRICLSSEVTEGNPLVSPCNCAGSAQFVHKQCHERWQRECLNNGNEERAEVCGTCGATYTLAPPPAQVALAAADQGLRAFIRSYVNDTILTSGRVISIGGRMPLDENAFMQGITQRVVHGGACVVRANALHLMTFCPRAAPRGLIKLLCSIGGPDTINERDSGGLTPLMLAATKMARDDPPDLTMVRELLACGADRSLVVNTADGLTALGIYREAVCHQASQFADMGFPRPPTINFEIEGLLMPANGPTMADRAVSDTLLAQCGSRATFYGAAGFHPIRGSAALAEEAADIMEDTLSELYAVAAAEAAAEGDDSSTGGSADGMTSFQKLVLDYYTEHDGTGVEGCDVNDVAAALGMPLVVVKAAVDFLSSEGHLYDTIDEDHHKPTVTE